MRVPLVTRQQQNEKEAEREFAAHDGCLSCGHGIDAHFIPANREVTSLTQLPCNAANCKCQDYIEVIF
jgi:hypothetical protein